MPDRGTAGLAPKTAAEAGEVTVELMSLGGTIAMVGEPARPALDGADLADAIPGLGAIGVRSLANVPGAHLTLPDTLAIVREVCAAAVSAPVVVTQGTDTLEEVAFLCDRLYDGDNPIVFTGAMRPASSPGADGPANLLDALAAARSPKARGLGVLVGFSGEVHAARDVRKEDSVGTTAFASPHCGPLGRVVEGGLHLYARPERLPAVSPSSLDGRVEIVTVSLGDGGVPIERAAGDAVDGIVVALLGAGHGSPAVLEAIAAATGRGIPVVLTCRPRIGALLRNTYGFVGAEPSMRATGAVPAGLLSAVAARMLLVAALGAGVDPRDAFAPFDP